MIKPNRASALVAFLMLPAAAVIAQQPADDQDTAAQAPTAARNAATPDAPRIDFATVDKDLNGSISRQESLVISDLESAFDMLDADRDEAITPTEFSRWSRAGESMPAPRDPATAPGGSAGAQHVPDAGEEE